MTTMYLIRHGSRFGPGRDAPLSPLAIRQAETTRDFLAVRPFDRCLCGPGIRARQTAALLAEPHRLEPVVVSDLAEGANGESFGDIYARVTPTFERLLTDFQGQSLLVVAQHTVTRIYLAGLLGLMPESASQVRLDTCGISIVTRGAKSTAVVTLNASFHLQGMAA